MVGIAYASRRHQAHMLTAIAASMRYPHFPTALTPVSIITNVPAIKLLAHKQQLLCFLSEPSQLVHHSSPYLIDNSCYSPPQRASPNPRLNNHLNAETAGLTHAHVPSPRPPPPPQNQALLFGGLQGMSVKHMIAVINEHGFCSGWTYNPSRHSSICGILRKPPFDSLAAALTGKAGGYALAVFGAKPPAKVAPPADKAAAGEAGSGAGSGAEASKVGARASGAGAGTSGAGTSGAGAAGAADVGTSGAAAASGVGAGGSGAGVKASGEGAATGARASVSGAATAPKHRPDVAAILNATARAVGQEPAGQGHSSHPGVPVGALGWPPGGVANLPGKAQEVLDLT